MAQLVGGKEETEMAHIHPEPGGSVSNRRPLRYWEGNGGASPLRFKGVRLDSITSTRKGHQWRY